MKRPRHVSRTAWLALAASATLAAAGWAVRRHWPPVRWAGDIELAALVGERERLQGNDDRTREALRRQHQAVSHRAWTENALATLPAKLGPGWRWESEPVPAGAGYRRIRLTALSGEIRRWPAWLGTIEELAQLPGATIETLDIAADGPAGRRRFLRFVLTLRFLTADTRTPGNPERAAALPARSRLRGDGTGLGGDNRDVHPALRPTSAAAGPSNRRLPAGLRSGWPSRPSPPAPKDLDNPFYLHTI